MANPKHIEILKKGASAWNKWRIDNPDLFPDLSGNDFRSCYLHRYDLSHANLKDGILNGTNISLADLSFSDLTRSDLQDANCRETNLNMTDLSYANCSGGDFRKAWLSNADLTGADFSNANLGKATLIRSTFVETKLNKSIFDNAQLGLTIFFNTNLGNSIGLENCNHRTFSNLDFLTLQKSGSLSLSFLRGCGLTDTLIEYLPSLLSPKAINFYSCFISYSTKDNEFVERLYADLQNKGVRCWYAPEDLKGGEKIHDQIDSAIKVHDKLLVILSQNSLKSHWVRTEIRRVLKAEKRENKRKLFPIRLVDLVALHNWECFDTDSGTDLAQEVREYFIPDFSDWKNHDPYQKALSLLLRDLLDKKTNS